MPGGADIVFYACVPSLALRHFADGVHPLTHRLAVPSKRPGNRNAWYWWPITNWRMGINECATQW